MKRIALATAVALALSAIATCVAIARAPRAKHCGCSAGHDHCVEPCANCCGPNGYADCDNNPSGRRP